MAGFDVGFMACGAGLAISGIRGGRVAFVVRRISKEFSSINMKGKHIMKKIVATFLLTGLIASAVMAEVKPSSGKYVHTMAAAAAPTTAKKHSKHRKHRRPAPKASAKHKK